MRYQEYKTVMFKVPFNQALADTITRDMNAMLAKGWEVVTLSAPAGIVVFVVYGKPAISQAVDGG
jgi:hypothetical protein